MYVYLYQINQSYETSECLLSKAKWDQDIYILYNDHCVLFVLDQNDQFDLDSAILLK